MDETIDEILAITESMTMTVTNFKPMYGSVVGADRYWSDRLDGQPWEVASLSDKQKALITATKMIDKLNFAGSKTEADQPLEWPRNGDTDPPQDVQEASYELAMALLKMVSDQKEYDNAFVRSRYFGKIRVDYEHGASVPEYLVAGIPSLAAWNYLKPYLSRNLGLKLRRG